MRLETFDANSFIAGIQVGRRIKVWDASRHARPTPSERCIFTEDGTPIVLEEWYQGGQFLPIVTE